MELLETTTNVDDLTKRIEALLTANRPAAARALVAALRRIAPPSPRIAELAAHACSAEGRLEDALQDLNASIEQFRDSARLRKCRASVRLRLGDTQAALADAAEAVVLEPAEPAGKALLGMLLLEAAQPHEAIVCLNEALAADGTNPAYRQSLAKAQEAVGDTDSALETLCTGIRADPDCTSLRNSAILMSLRCRDFITAYRLAEDARAAGVADACSFGMMGHALSSLGRHEEAADAYAEALKLGPADPYVRHLVAAAGTIPSETRAPLEYLRAVFDGYAERFESHLISLGYRTPGLIRAALLQRPSIKAGENFGPVLDLGCGTGLVAVALSDLPIAPLVGVDVSPRMLAAAAAKQLYSELHECDLLKLLSEITTSWRLVLAADVLIYFGDLEAVLAAVHTALEPGGWFVFSLEELLPNHDGTMPGDGRWALRWQGRYGHTAAYVAASAEAARFTVRTLRREALRYEADAPVPGLFAVLERKCHDC